MFWALSIYLDVYPILMQWGPNKCPFLSFPLVFDVKSFCILFCIDFHLMLIIKVFQKDFCCHRIFKAKSSVSRPERGVRL